MSEPQIVLFNSGKNPISGKLPDGTEYKLLPQKAGCFPDSEAKKLKRLFSDVLIDEADARAKFSPAMVMAEAAQAAASAPAAAPEVSAAAPAPQGAPVKLSPLTGTEKEQIRLELVDLMKRLKDRGMGDEEIDAMTSSAEIAAEMETGKPLPIIEPTETDIAAIVGDTKSLGIDDQPKKNLIRRILDGMA